jgi:hypothetical protein
MRKISRFGGIVESGNWQLRISSVLKRTGIARRWPQTAVTRETCFVNWQSKAVGTDRRVSAENLTTTRTTGHAVTFVSPNNTTNQWRHTVADGQPNEKHG